MFTGIITHLGAIEEITQKGDTVYKITSRMETGAIPIGASIAHSGVCLTVTEKFEDGWLVEASKETLDLTTMKDWRVGDVINLEASLKLGDELGGHLVFGHVDGITKIVALEQEGDSWRIRFAMPEAHAHLIAKKGSVAMNGVSLTVNDVSADSFGINLISHTWQATNFHRLKIGDTVNYEIDMLARYVERQLSLKGDK